MVQCVVVGCNSSSKSKGQKTSFHRFPADENLKKEWIARINRVNYGLHNIKAEDSVCGLHFIDPDDFILPSPKQALRMGLDKKRFCLKPGAVPSQLLNEVYDDHKIGVCDEKFQSFMYEILEVEHTTDFEELENDDVKGIQTANILCCMHSQSTERQCTEIQTEAITYRNQSTQTSPIWIELGMHDVAISCDLLGPMEDDNHNIKTSIKLEPLSDDE